MIVSPVGHVEGALVAGAGVVVGLEESAQGSKPPSMAAQAAISASGLLHKQSRVLNCETFLQP